MWITALSSATLPHAVPPLFSGILADMLLHAVPDDSAPSGSALWEYLFRRMRDFAPLFPPSSPVQFQFPACCCFSPAANIEARTFNDPVARLAESSGGIGHANRQLSGLLEGLQGAPPPHALSAALEPTPAAADVTAISAGIDVLVAEVLTLLGSHNIKDVIRVHGLLGQVHRMLAVLARAIELRGTAMARRAAMQAL
ncbi:MAG TPA: hypothetical protein VN428_02190 [Bryobacteraceae bacterium]|nr:hypothetical protein [Bryobacteraceae bacterium]